MEKIKIMFQTTNQITWFSYGFPKFSHGFPNKPSYFPMGFPRNRIMGSPGVQELPAAASPTTHAASPGVFAGFSASQRPI